MHSPENLFKRSADSHGNSLPSFPMTHLRMMPKIRIILQRRTVSIGQRTHSLHERSTEQSPVAPMASCMDVNTPHRTAGVVKGPG